MPLCSPRLLSLIIVFCTSSVSSNLTTNRWKALGRQTVTSFEMAETGRSKVDCMRKCTRYSHCNRVAFRPSSSLCYLLPSYNSSAADGQSDGESDGESDGDSIMVYQNTEDICSYTDAPVTNGSVTWRHTLTSLEGDVTCDADFLWSTNNTSVSCSVDNRWTVRGECRRYFWRSVIVGQVYPTPQPVVVGWKMCASGTPYTDGSSISANLYAANGDRALKVRFFYAGSNADTIKASSHVNGAFVNIKQVTPSVFPIKKSSPFRLEIHATSEYVLDVLVNGTSYYQHTSPISVTSTVKVVFSNDAFIRDLNLWCF